MQFDVDCEVDDARPIYLDDAAFDKILANLLSNSTKYTLEGRVKLQVRYLKSHVELEVSDVRPFRSPAAYSLRLISYCVSSIRLESEFLVSLASESHF